MFGRSRIHTRLKNPGGASFNSIVAALFANGEQGFAYDHNDFSTLFQDSAGTIPVTAADQPVGLQLDKSKGLVLGGELLTNGSFSAGSTGWMLSPTVSVAGGVCSFSSANNGESAIQAAASVVANKWYSVTYTIVSISSGSFSSGIGSSLGTVRSTPGTYTDYLVAPSAQVLVRARANGTSGVIDNISVRELPGNHRFQTAAASRPMLRYNATTGSYYLQYDGTDDFLQTNAIDFTGTDTVSMFAGVRKLSDAASGLVVGLGAGDVSTNNGSFGVFAPDPNLPGANYRFDLRGDAGVATGYRATSYAAPISSVLSCAVSLAGADRATEVMPRVNGVVPTLVAGGGATAGGGQLGNFPAYFGRRAGTSLPFNGHEYSQICVGRLATAAEIANVERLLARQVGVSLP